MKLTDEELDAILAEGGLTLAQPHDPRGSYRKDAFLFTRCDRCGVEAHYRLRYVLEKNAIGERVCRACYWLGWYDGGHDLVRKTVGRALEAGHDLDELIDRGLVTAGESLGWREAEALADENGYDLVDLIRGRRRGDDVMLVRCRECGRQTAERPCNVAYGCTCAGARARREAGGGPEART